MSTEDLARRTLSSRTLGEVLPVSIATALAVESLLGMNPEAPVEDHHLDEFDSLYINVRTLVRNLLGAIQSEDRQVSVGPQYVLEYVINEMITITRLMKEEAPEKTVVFYTPSYNEAFIKSYKHGIIRQYKTKQQSYYWERETYVQEGIIKELAKREDQLICLATDTQLPKDHVKVMILTHYPIDLLSRYQFRDLKLIESHTGAVKPHSEWYTKLTGYKDRPTTPFDRATLQVFGDGVMFMASKRKIRQTFIELATKYKWTNRSTEELVKYSAAKLRDPFFDIYVQELYSK